MTRPGQFFVPKSKIRYPKSLVNFGPMIGRYKIITLCGSTKSKDEFIAVQKRLTLEGNIVISAGFFGHIDDEEV